MKLLFTNHRLRDRGGSELFTAEVAGELARRRHDVAVFSTVGGPVADAIRAAGIAVVHRPAACPFIPDVIHGQHHLETMAALTAWPSAPALYFLHGYGPWEERPTVHPRLLRYAAPSGAFLPWLEVRCAAPPGQVHVIPNFFDPVRFPHQRPRGRALSRALVYHNTMDPAGPVFASITVACDAAGLELESAGASFGRVLEDPGAVLPEYDVVFASGRSALEAMACGCAVIPVTREQTGQWIGPERFDAALDLNFTLRPDDSTAADDLNQVLCGIQLEVLPGLAVRVRRDFTLHATVDRLESAYQEILALPLPSDPCGEGAALADYLTSLAEYVKQSDEDRIHLIKQRDGATRRAIRWKEKAGQMAERIEVIRGALENGSWWHRRLWRRLRRHL